MIIEALYQHTNIFLLNSRLFSTSVATIFSFCLSMALFPPYIGFLRRFRFSSELNNGSTPQEKKHEPVMPAGILFLVVIALTCALTARFNSYVMSALAIYVFFGVIGAVDDVAKVVNKWRLARGEISKEDYTYKADGISATLRLTLYVVISAVVAVLAYKYIPNINGHITIPFVS
ncbi:MAG: phospho-N-acetylmuramoyl-pentapeptide-transferase, partial [Chitinivibrionales bacterium]|nr:phospho-N-acetylmuramoyl-pentapeptide-transferase [Chitinivibrionales bacterium]